MPHRPKPERIKVKFECQGKKYEIEYKAGKKAYGNEPGEEGVVTLVLSQFVMGQLAAKSYLDPDQIIKIPNVESFRNDKHWPPEILSIVEVGEGDSASGDCVCWEDHLGRWRCICEN